MELYTENQNLNMENPLPLQTPSIPSTPQPLQPISSERQNQQRIPQSPSLPLFLDGNGSPRKSHQPRLSDTSEVRARIAYLNSVSQSNSPVRPGSPKKSSMVDMSSAAIQRAILGREEAESTLATLSAELESAKSRERMVSERVETLMEQLTETRNRQRHERSVYEKEIKHSKKTEYKAELAVIKLQEDLREVRSELESYKVRSEHDKAEKEKARQEAFERAYVVAGMTEEVQDLKRRLEVVEQERDAAVAMAASKIQIDGEKTMQTPAKVEQENIEKRKQPTSNFDIMYLDEVDLDGPDCPIEIRYTALQTEVDFLRRQVKEDQETIHFMNMQCQFKACPCRMAERDGVRFVHDYDYDAKVRARNAKRRKVEGFETEPPLPVFKSWKQKREETKGKQPIRRDEPALTHTVNVQRRDITNDENGLQGTAVSSTANAVIEEPAVVKTVAVDKVEHTAVLEEAANIPLPSLQPMEIDPSDDTPEPTAQLEDLTQVIVEAGASSNNFHFSTSTTSNRAAPEPVMHLQNSHNVRMSDDLFDISPPKRHMPPRPSTAMGVLTVESPVRLVPISPHVNGQYSTASDSEMQRPTTTRVALNDTSPGRQSRQQRHRPKSTARDRSRGRSPAAQGSVELDRSSPAPTTLFPITPGAKHECSHQQYVQVEPRPQTVQGFYPESRKEFSTTTTVPLRGDTEGSMVNASSSSTANQVAGSGGTPFSVPGTPNMTREAALAQIRARRDRARSINMRKSAEEGGNKTPGSVARRGVNLKDRLGDAKGRDFSQASAPGRI